MLRVLRRTVEGPGKWNIKKSARLGKGKDSLPGLHAWRKEEGTDRLAWKAVNENGRTTWKGCGQETLADRGPRMVAPKRDTLKSDTTNCMASSELERWKLVVLGKAEGGGWGRQDYRARTRWGKSGSQRLRKKKYYAFAGGGGTTPGYFQKGEFSKQRRRVSRRRRGGRSDKANLGRGVLPEEPKTAIIFGWERQVQRHLKAGLAGSF